MIGWIIGAFIAGEAAGLFIAAIVSGRLDKYLEWRYRKHEQKNVLHLHSRSGSGAGGGIMDPKRR